MVTMQKKLEKFTKWLKNNVVCVTNISLLLLVLLHALQLAAGAKGLFSQGTTAVIHGCSVCALGHNLGEKIAFIMATLQEGT